MAMDEELRVHAEWPVEYTAGTPAGEAARPSELVREMKTFRRVGEERRSKDAPAKVAVIVCHGMGQQVPYETIDMIAGSLLGRDTGQPAPPADSHVRQVKFGDDLLGRAEITLERKGHRREVHIYEAYWAPLTAGKVTLTDVVWFLLKAATCGSWAMLAGALQFKRWMFGDYRKMRIRPGEFVALIFALLVIASLILLYLDYAWSVATYLVSSGPDWLSNNLVRNLRAVLVLFTCVVVSGGVALGVPALVRSHLRTGLAAKVLTKIVSLAALLVLLAICGLGVCVAILYGGRILTTFGSPLPICANAPPSAIWPWLISIHTAETHFLSQVGCAMARPVWFYVSALLLGILFAVGRWFLIQYIGDVTAYVAAHTASRFYELRTEIQQVAFKVFNAVYGAKLENGDNEYGTIVVTGHSLGSVLSYDALNSFINYDALLQDHNLRVLERTPMLVTFGSPLDKTAFLFKNQIKGAIFREALAATKQPMILDYEARPQRWINIFNRADWFSGSLDYYDDPLDRNPAHLQKRVENIEDREGFFPLLAHTEYPGHPELREALMQGIFRVPR